MKRPLFVFAIASIGLTVATFSNATSKVEETSFPEAKSPQDTNVQKVTQLPQSVVRLEVSKPLPAEDVIAIHELISRVYLAEDSLDREGLGQAVIADFILEDSVTGRSVGRQAFGDLVLKTAEFRAGSRHMAINIAVSGAARDTAVAVHYLMAFRVFGTDPKLGELPRPVAHGVVRDQLVKSRGKWRLAHRISDQMSMLPSFVPDPQLRSKAARIVVFGDK